MEQTAKHTPGPWEEEEKDGERVRVTRTRPRTAYVFHISQTKEI